MKIAADTNIVVRMLTADDGVQLSAAVRLLTVAELIALPIVTLVETVWVLRSRYKWTGAEVASALRVLLNDQRIKAEWSLVEAGLDLLDRGGDFADAVIEADGRRLGAETLVTFDEQAARLLADAGGSVTRPA